MATKVNNSLSKYQRVLKRVRKDHPNMSIENARKKASGIYKSVGKPKKAKVAGKRAKAKVAGRKPVKRSVTKTEKISTVGAKKRTSNPISRGVTISRNIENLELLLKNTSGVKAKNNLKRRINSLHDQLDVVSQRF